MTITYNKVPALTGAKVADVAPLVHSNFRVVDTEVINSNGEEGTVTTHVYVSGDSSDEMLCIVRRAYNVNQDITRTSVRLVIDVEDSTLEDPDLGNTEVGVFWNHPGRVAADRMQLATAITTLFNTVCFPFDGTTGAPSHQVVNLLDNRITELPWS